MPTEILEVAAVSDLDLWTLGAGADKVVAVNSPNDDLTSYIYTVGTTYRYQKYTLAASSIPGGATINSVRIFSRMQRGGANDSTVRFRLYLGANYTESITYSLVAAWVDRTVGLSRPGGGNWSVADLAVLKASITNRLDLDQANCTSLWIIVNYTPPADTDKMLLVFR